MEQIAFYVIVLENFASVGISEVWVFSLSVGSFVMVDFVYG